MKKQKILQSLPWFGLALIIFLLDQVTKTMIVKRFVEYGVFHVTSFLNLTLVYNPGAAFSFLAKSPGWQKYFFVSLACIASVVIAFLLVKKSEKKIFCASLALLMGGALGNAIDRLFYKGVVDFIDFHYKNQYHWFTFNVADIAIVVGVALLFIHELKQK